METLNLMLVCGRKSSGKSIFGSIAKEKGFPVIEMGDIFRELFHKEEDIINFRKKDPLLLAKFTLEKINHIKNNAQTVIVVGVRTIEELRFFEKHGKCLLIYIHVDKDVWEKRANTHKKSIQAIEEKIGVEKLYKEAHIIIENNGSLEEYIKKVKTLFEFICAFHKK